jgi:hypothetical protein
MQGISGVQGFKGFQGFKGNQGLKGPQGFKGNQGIDGSATNTGATGPQGLKGPQGYKGVQGVIGPIGIDENWGSQASTSFPLEKNKSYYLTGSTVTVRLPHTAINVDDFIQIYFNGSTSVTIEPPNSAPWTLKYKNYNMGTLGPTWESISYVNTGDSVKIVCVATNLWAIVYDLVTTPPVINSYSP